MLKAIRSLAKRQGAESIKRPIHESEHELIIKAGKRFLSKIGMAGHAVVHMTGNKPALLLTINETNKRLSMIALAVLAQELVTYLSQRHELTIGSVFWEISPDANNRIEWPDETHFPERIRVRELDPEREAHEIAALIRANQ